MKEIKLPGGLNDMTLKEYIEVCSIIQKNEGENINRKVVQYYTGYPLKEVDNMKKVDYDMITEQINKVIMEKTELKPIVKIDKLTFGFIPKMDDITPKEYIEITEQINDIEKWPSVMGVLFRPVTEVKKTGWFKKKTYYYDIEKFDNSDKYKEHMLKLPAGYAMSAYLFFGL